MALSDDDCPDGMMPLPAGARLEDALQMIIDPDGDIQAFKRFMQIIDVACPGSRLFPGVGDVLDAGGVPLVVIGARELPSWAK